jgi:hypothetical protein
MPEKIEITTTLMKLGEVNLNGRIYENNENLREQINNFNRMVEENGVMFGELGWPEWPVNFKINIGAASHSIKNVRIEGDNVVGDITILNTVSGKILKETLDQTVFRPSSIGNVSHDGTVNIQKIISFNAIPLSEDSFAEMKPRPPKPEIKRIYSEEDPYGEENWEI